MRARRGVYAAVFLVAALGASALVYFAQPRNGIVRAKVDIAVLTPITAEMVEVVSVSPADAPANAARSVDAVVGRYTSVPLLAGQDVDVRVLETNPGQRAFGFGAPLEAGQVAFALPVEPGQAVGGALAAGARVDVVAVPNALKTQVSGADSPSAVVLGQARRADDPHAGGPSADRCAGLGPRRRRHPAEARLGRGRDPCGPAAGVRRGRVELDFYLALSPVAAP